MWKPFIWGWQCWITTAWGLYTWWISSTGNSEDHNALLILDCRIQPLICSKWNRMVLFLSKKCSENDAYSRTSLKIMNMVLSRPTGWRWTCHTKSCSILPFQQRMHCRLCSELLYRTQALLLPFNISSSAESITMNYKHEPACAKWLK